jgi:hypothetical protein
VPLLDVVEQHIHARQQMPVQLARNAFLVGEVVVEKADGHARLGTQVLDGRVEEPPLHEQPQRHAQRLHMA